MHPAGTCKMLAGGENNILNLAASMGAPSPTIRKQDLQNEFGEFDYGWPLALGAAETPLFSESGPSRVVQLGIIDVLCTYYLLDQQGSLNCLESFA